MTEPPFVAPQHASDLLKLPSGDWISVMDVTAGRLSEKANRQTGEVGASVYIHADGSWYTVHFEQKDDGAAFLDALIEYRNALHRPSAHMRRLDRAAVEEMLADLHARSEKLESANG